MTETQNPQKSSAESTPQSGKSRASESPAGEYRVLARKYRPSTFAELIGQDALVRTLTNAINSGRLAHAFILTGVRGVGKTTTARILARALNCIGPDGTGGPTPDPCGVCSNCRAIAEDRHVDVLEMDAASRTGVDDIREIIDGVRYLPTSARNKIYIIDEVHMLSKNAFNALLKTLEEPPEHVIFIFATTEIRKVPITVLSRCQRFDLRRVPHDDLVGHFTSIAEKEGADIAPGAIQIIARAADGSVRDGLSLLDQALAHSGGAVSEDAVRDMLGLADRTVTFDLLDCVLRGDIAAALGLIDEQHAAGADPVSVLADMLDLTHWLTRIKVVPDAADNPTVPEAERVRGRDMVAKLSMAEIARAWQMLLKGVEETRIAPQPFQAVEMILVRLAYTAALPTPAEAIKSITGASKAPAPASGVSPASRSTGGNAAAISSGAPTMPGQPSSPPPPPDPARAAIAGRPAADVVQPRGAPETAPDRAGRIDLADSRPDPVTFDAVMALVEEKREAILHTNLINNVHIVRFEAGRIEFRPGETAPSDLTHNLMGFLNQHTARRWIVSVSSEPGQPTLRQRLNAKDTEARDKAREHPLIKEVMAEFPDAKITKVTTLAPVTPDKSTPED